MTKPIFISFDVIAASIIKVKKQMEGISTTTRQECYFFQQQLIPIFDEVGLDVYFDNESFDSNYFINFDNTIKIKNDYSDSNINISYLGYVPYEILKILYDTDIMLEILICFKKQELEKEKSNILKLESKLKKDKVLIKYKNEK